MKADKWPCVFCGGLHRGLQCPRVKSLGFGDYDQITSVEFWEPHYFNFITPAEEEEEEEEEAGTDG